MKKIQSLLVAGLLLFFLADTTNAKTIKKVAQTGLQFLSVDLAARPAAMGGAFIMAGKGADAIFYNPAGITELRASTDAFFSQTSWIADINMSTGAVVRDFGILGVFGLSFINVDYGESIGTQVADNQQGFVETGNLDIGAYAVGLSYARSLTDQFRIGGQAKFASERLGSNLMPDGTTTDNEAQGMVFDFGTIFYPGWKSFHFGMSVRNFSPQFTYEEETFEAPLTFRIGFAMDMLDLVGGIPNNSLLLAVDALHPRAYTERFHVGAEYWYSDLFALRAGYKTNYDEEGLSLGFGLQYGLAGVNLKFDYSYTQLGVFNNVNRFTIGTSF